jgi:hypothetical protein
MKWILIFTLSLFAPAAFAVGTVTSGITQTQLPNGKIVSVVQVDWTTDASGDATVSLSLNGYLMKVVTDPGATAPTDDYDITLVQNGIDAAAGTLANRDTANTEQVYPVATNAQTPIFLVGSHTFTVAAGGNAKVGTAYLYLIQSL